MNIRNIAIVGHSGEGKTTLCEAMLFNGGVIDRQGKVKLFANLIDHLSLVDLGLNIMGDTGEDFRKELTVKLTKYCEDNNIFNNFDKVHMWVVSERTTGKDELHIIAARNDKYSNSYMFKLAYKIDKI